MRTVPGLPPTLGTGQTPHRLPRRSQWSPPSRVCQLQVWLHWVRGRGCGQTSRALGLRDLERVRSLALPLRVTADLTLSLSNWVVVTEPATGEVMLQNPPSPAGGRQQVGASQFFLHPPQRRRYEREMGDSINLEGSKTLGSEPMTVVCVHMSNRKLRLVLKVTSSQGLGDPADALALSPS